MYTGDAQVTHMFTLVGIANGHGFRYAIGELVNTSQLLFIYIQDLEMANSAMLYSVWLYNL